MNDDFLFSNLAQVFLV